MNTQIQLLVLAHVLLQGTLLIVLPKWWKAAGCPSLLVLPIVVGDLTSGGNLSGLVTLWLTPFAIGWLVLILTFFGIAKAVQTNQPKAATDDDAVGPRS